MENNENMNMEEDAQNEMKQNEIQEENMNNDEQEENENELMYIYEWVDSVELSRPKKNIARDFSDALLLAEIIKSYFPKLVDLHNYPSCSNTKHKESNWNVLNNKVLKKLGIKLTKNEIDDIVNCKHLAIEHLLQRVYNILQKNVGILHKAGSTFGGEAALKKTLEEKENVIKQLQGIVEVLELKLKNSNDMEKYLENQIQQLKETLSQNGINVE